MLASIASIQCGRVAPLGPNGVPSAIVKRPVEGPVAVHAQGLDGDEHADPRYHGGRDKAVYGYGAAHYAAWAAEHPQHAERLATPGAFGENLTIEGLDETAICVGDVHAIGSVRLQVTEPREPCFKFALRFEDKGLPQAMLRNGRSGWYYRVIEAGRIATGDALVLVERPFPDLPFTLLVDLLYHRRGEPDALARLATASAATDRIRAAAKRKLARLP